jgi:galactokinase
MSVLESALTLFEETFGYAPQGVWSAPGRVNLIGEHTDYTGGFVMPFAIDQRACIAISPRLDNVVRAIAADHDRVEVDLADIALGHPTGFAGYLAGAAWIFARDTGVAHGWDIALVSDIPVGAGLSSSAALTCATLLAMHDIEDTQASRESIALQAQQVEHQVIGTPCGIMDQSASLLSEKDHLLFLDTRDFRTELIPWSAGEQELTFLVTNTKAPHMLADGQYALRRQYCEEATSILGVSQLRDATLADLEAAYDQLSSEQRECALHVITENQRVIAVRDLLNAGNPREVGPILNESHTSLRDNFHVTVEQTDLAAELAVAAGALGARMIGGGFGGCVLSLVPTESCDHIAQEIAHGFMESGFTLPESFRAQPQDGAHRNV